MAWVESNCPSDCGIVWGATECYDNSQRPPKPPHNRLGSYSRPRLSLFFKVGYKTNSKQDYSLDYRHMICNRATNNEAKEDYSGCCCYNDLQVSVNIYYLLGIHRTLPSKQCVYTNPRDAAVCNDL